MSDNDIDPTTPRKNPKAEVTKINGRALKPSTLRPSAASACSN